MPAKIALYRILQEALNNIHCHSGTDEAYVDLWADEQYVHVKVVDLGDGFTPPPLEGPFANEAHRHIGLRGMRDRVNLVGGSLELASAPGRGTMIHVKVPIEG